MHLGDHRCCRHHGWMHALLDAAFGALRYAEELDAIPEFPPLPDIGLRYVRNALEIDVVRRDARADARLVRIDSLPVSLPSMSKVGSASA